MSSSNSNLNRATKPRKDQINVLKETYASEQNKIEGNYVTRKSNANRNIHFNE